jgi:tetratricopeptide (TPR) repeat protein
MTNKNVNTAQYEKKGEYEKAAKIYLEYAKEEYKDAEDSYLGYIWAAEFFKAAAFCYNKMGKLEEAKKLFEKVIEAYEKSIVVFALTEETYTAPGIEFHINWTRKRIGDIYSQLNKKEQAKKIYQKVIDFLDIKLRSYERKAATNKLFYGDAGLYCEMLAMVYQKLKEYENALEHCNKAKEYLGKSKQGALAIINELDYNYFVKDFVEELVVSGYEKGVFYVEENPEIFKKLGDFKTRINLRRELIIRERETHS